MHQIATAQKDVHNAEDINEIKDLMKMGLAVQILMQSPALHMRVVKKTKKQNNKHLLRQIQMLSKTNQKKR